MTINALLIEAADALQAMVDELVQAHTVPGTATLDSADVTLKVEAEQDLVNRLREAALVVGNPAEISQKTAKTRMDAGFEGGGPQPAAPTAATTSTTHTVIERKRLEQMATLLAVATFQTPGVRALCAELVNVGVKALMAPPAQEPVAWPDCWVVVKDGQIIAAHDAPGSYDGIEAVRYTPLASPTGFDAEFLSKRLARVAELVGVSIPPHMTHEQVAEFAGTVLGDIARKLEAAQPAPVQEPVALPLHETKEMHDAVMSVLYKGGVTRTTTDALWQAYRQVLVTTPPAAQPAPVQEPVAWIYQNANTEDEYIVWRKGIGGRNWRPLYTTPPAAQQQPPRFPTMLRKMWSGAEVQAWIDEHWHSAPAPAPAIPPVLVRDAAKALGCTESDVCRELVKLGRPPRSTNMAISGEELEALAGVLRPAAPAIPSGWSLTLDGQHFKLKSPEGRWWDFGPNTDGPNRLVWEFLSAMRAGVPAQKGEQP